MLTYRVLSALLSYPTPELKDASREGMRILCNERLLSDEQTAAVSAFVRWLLETPQLDAEAAYVDVFDRSRSTSLHLFEHIHGDSRARGEAMHRLLLRYRAHGLELTQSELPDFLPLFLEFLSTRPSREAAKHLAEVADIVALIGQRLAKRGAPHAVLLEVVASLADMPDRHRTALPTADEDRDDTPAALDAAWEEAPVTFTDAEPLADAGPTGALQRVQS